MYWQTYIIRLFFFVMKMRLKDMRGVEKKILFDTIRIRRGFFGLYFYFNSSKQTKHIKNDLIFALFVFFSKKKKKPKYMSIKIYWANKILKSFGNKNLYKFYMYTGSNEKRNWMSQRYCFFFCNKIYWISGLLNFLSRCFSFWSFFF